jgi:LEA14-like dessication related protein
MNPIAKRLILATLMGSLILPLTSCETLGAVSKEFLLNAPKPEVFFSNLQIANLTEQAAELDLTLDVKNPYPVPLFAKKLDFALSSAGEQILSSVSEQPINIGARSTDPVKLRVKLPYTEALKSLSTIKPGAVIPLTTAVNLSLTGEEVSPLNFNVERTTDVPIPAVPEIKVESVKWEELSLSKASAKINLAILNTNSFPVDLSTLDYTFALADMPVAKGLIEEAINLQPGAEETLQLGFSLEPSKMGFAAFNMLRSKNLEYDLKGTLGAGTPFGPIDWKVDKSAKTPLLGN